MKKSKPLSLIVAALLLTLLADTLLVLLDIRHAAGVFLFCCVQILYGFILYHRLPESRGKKKWLRREYLMYRRQRVFPFRI